VLTLSVILTILSGLVCLVWLSRHILISREQRDGLALSERYGAGNEGSSAWGPLGAPRVRMLVAAKDEEENIEKCLRGLLAQDYPNLEVIVCDDRSTDRTPQIVDALAAEGPRLRVIHVKELPEGWCGKNNAMRMGIEAAGSTALATGGSTAPAAGEWICMTDADCRFLSPRTLSVAVQYARDSAADLLSVLPTLEMKGFWENAVQPTCTGLMMIWFRPDKVNNPDKSNAYANGAFMLVKRSAYEAIGGHDAVKDQVNEDMHMADRIKRAGLRLRMVRSEGLMLVRMYTSLGRMISGWSRIFYGTFVTQRRLIASLLVLCMMGLFPYVVAAVGLALAAAGAGPDGAWLTCGLVACATIVAQLTAVDRFYRWAGSRSGLAYPLATVITIIALIGSLRKLRPGAKVVWRSTSYARKQPAP
jgi:cellulose synthase/poly-beta-1,6-N-acetylglucosamine synthase-like glycosyltransferase